MRLYRAQFERKALRKVKGGHEKVFIYFDQQNDSRRCELLTTLGDFEKICTFACGINLLSILHDISAFDSYFKAQKTKIL